MKTRLRPRLLPAAFLLFLATLACGSNLHMPVDAVGSQDLPVPSVGLGGLNAYRAVLTLGFTGVQEQTPSAWSKTYTLAVVPASGTRLLNITATGLPSGASLDGWMAGSDRGMLLTRPGAAAPCEAVKNQSGALPVLIEPAALLPPVTGARLSGEETLQGTAVRKFTFDQASLGFPGQGKLDGQMWLSVDGSYLVKYSLRAEGGPDLFGQDMTGAMTWEYQLSDINSSVQVDLPENCPPGLIDAPLIAGAEVLADEPGYLEFTVPTDFKSIAAFYRNKLASLGYIPTDGSSTSDAPSQLTFTRSELVLDLLMEKITDNSSHVLLVLSRAGPETGTTTVPTPTASASDNLPMRLSQAILLLSGTTQQASILPSYHFEMNEALPVVDQQTGKIKVSAVQVSADVQAANLYLKHIVDQQVVSEGYVVDDQEYALKNGQVEKAPGTVEPDWAGLQMDIVTPYSVASLGPVSQGQDSVDGRATDVIALDSSRADPAVLANVQSMSLLAGFNITSASGTAWLDQQTGALLKLILDYSAEPKAQPGSGASVRGHIELVVSQVGRVTVKLP